MLMSSSKRPGPDPILEVEVARCFIWEVRGAVQVIQNWFMEFRILSEVRGMDEVVQVFIE